MMMMMTMMTTITMNTILFLVVKSQISYPKNNLLILYQISIFHKQKLDIPAIHDINKPKTPILDFSDVTRKRILNLRQW